MNILVVCGLALSIVCLTRAKSAIERNDVRSPLWLALASALALPAMLKHPAGASLALLSGAVAVLLYCFSVRIEEETATAAAHDVAAPSSARRPRAQRTRTRRRQRRRRRSAVRRTARAR